MALPLDKLTKALRALEQTISTGASGGTLTRKSSDPHSRVKEAVHRVKSTFLATDLSHPDSKHTVTGILHLFVDFLHHANEGLRTAAYEAFLSISRHLIILGQESRLLLILISELIESPQARSAAALLSSLSRTIHLARPKRLPIFATYTLNALEDLLKRPEEAIHLAIIAHIPLLFKTLGPQLEKLSIPKKDASLPFEKRSHALRLLNVILDKCLDVRGTANRSAVLTIFQLAQYSTLCRKKALSFCTAVLSSRDDQSSPLRLTAAFNVLKGLWEQVVGEEDVNKPLLRKLMCLLLCFTHSSVNDVLIASFECLTAVIGLDSLPRDMLSFYPPEVDLTEQRPLLKEPQESIASPYAVRKAIGAANSLLSEQSSCNSSVIDLPMQFNDMDNISVMTDCSSVGRSINGDGSVSDRVSPTESWYSDESRDGRSEIIDPLIHSDLYEEEQSKRVDDTPSPPSELSSTVLSELPDFFDGDDRLPSITFCEYSTVLIAYRFLLNRSSPGLIPDTKSRVSHKMLAFGLLTVCATRSSQIILIHCPRNGHYQDLTHLTEFIYHSDDKLSAAAVNFVATALTSAGDLATVDDCKEWMGFVWQKMSVKPLAATRRALLQAVTGRQVILERLGLLEDAIRLALTSSSLSYGLLKISVSKFLCSLKWSSMSSSTVALYQTQVLDCLITLLSEKDQSVTNAVAENLPNFVSNADFGLPTNVHSLCSNYDVLGATPAMSMVINLPESFSYRESQVDNGISRNLSKVVGHLVQGFSNHKDVENSNSDSFDQVTGFITAIHVLSSSFPPHQYHESWNPSGSSTTHGLIAIISDLSESSVTTTHSLSTAFKTLATLLGGYLSHQQVEMVKQKNTGSSKDNIPSLADAPLMERLFIAPMRVLNLYYCLVEDRRMELSGRQSLSLTRPITKDMHPLDRIATYSRLPNTGITLVKNTMYTESPLLNTIAVLLRGSFKNFLDTVDPEYESRLLELMIGAVDLLCVILETSRVPFTRPLIPEMCSYIESLTVLSPLSMTRLSTQLLKSLFGRNSTNLNIGHLKSIRISLPDPWTDERDRYDYHMNVELQHLKLRLGNPDMLENIYKEHFGWIGSNETVIPVQQTTTEVTSALRYFEYFITRMIAFYASSTNVEAKQAVITLFAQLRVAGIEFDLADPRKMVTVAVEEQLGHIQYPEMLREAFIFLIVLARGGSMRWNAIKQHAIAICQATQTKDNAGYVLDAMELVLGEFLRMRKEEPTDLLSHLFSVETAATFLRMCPSKYLQLCHLWMHVSRKDEEKWKSSSSTVMRLLTSFFSRPRLPSIWTSSKEAMESVAVVYSSLSPSSFLLIEDFVSLLNSRLQHANDDEGIYRDNLIVFAPIFFLIFSDIIDEQRLLHRTEPHFPRKDDSPFAWLFRPACQWISKALENLRTQHPHTLANDEDVVIDAVVLMLRVINAGKESALLSREFVKACKVEGLFDKDIFTSPRLALEWTMFLSGHEEGESVSTGLKDSFKLVEDSYPHRRYLQSIVDQSVLFFCCRNPHPSTAEGSEAKKTLLSGDERRMRLIRAAQNNPKLVDSFIRAIPTEITDVISTVQRHGKTDEIAFFMTSSLRIHPSLVSSFPSKEVHYTTPCVMSLLECESTYDVLISSLSLGHPSPRLCDALLHLSSEDTHRFLDHLNGSPMLLQIVQMTLVRAAKRLERAGADLDALPIMREAVSRFLKILTERVDLWNALVFTILANANSLAMQKVETTEIDELMEDIPRILEAAASRLEKKERVVETYSALSFVLLHPDTIDSLSKSPLLFLRPISRLLLSLLPALKKACGEACNMKDNETSFSMGGLSVDSEEHGQLYTCFSASQYIMSVYRKYSLIDDDPLGRCLRSLMRIPLLNPFALTPKTALDGGWHPHMELKQDGISVTLPPIHKLNDIDILDDFTWRTLFLGWTSRMQFESVWVSLLGVLSSTPSGDELESESATEAVTVSALAVRRLSSFLLLTQLEPQPGNPIGGRYRLPSRDVASTFNKTEDYNRLSDLLANLTEDDEPETILRRSIEWTIGTRNIRKEYHVDQLSIYDLWRRIGLSDDGRSPFLRPIRSVSTYFLDQLRMELDAGSAVRSLYEIFSHWFSRGIQAMPIELLSETLRSISLLCDLFEDQASFTSLDADMRMVAASGHVSEGDEQGFVLLSLCKAVSVCGQEYERASEEQLRKLQSLLSTGLDHRSTFVRCCALRGILYLLQSLTADSLTLLVKYLVDWTQRELDRFAPVTDPIYDTGDHTAIEYKSLVWSLAFRILEHPSRVAAKGRLFQTVLDVFLCTTPSPTWQLEALTIGLQELMLHSQTFTSPCARTAISCLESYSTLPAKLPFALRLLSVAVHRERGHLKDLSKLFASLIETSRVCDVSELNQIIVTCVSLRLLDEDPSDVIDWLSSLLFPPSGRSHPQPVAIIQAMHRLSRSLIGTPEESSLLVSSRRIIDDAKNRSSNVVTALTLAAISPFPHFAYLYDALLSYDLSSNSNDWTLFVQSYRRMIS